MQQFQRVSVHKGNQSVEINKLGPKIWISHDWPGVQPWVGLGGHRPTHLGARRTHWEFLQLSGWLVSDDPTGEEPGCGGPGLAWLQVVRPFGHTAKFSKMKLEAAYGKLTFKSLATALVDMPVVCMPIAQALKTWDICGIVFCEKRAHFSMAFFCPQDKVHLCNDHAV